MKKLILIIAILINNSSNSQISFNWSSDDYYSSSIGNQGILKTIDDITIQIYHTNPNADLIVENGYIFTNYDNSSNEIIVKYSNQVNLKSTLLSSKDGNSFRVTVEHFREDDSFIVRQSVSGPDKDYNLLTNYDEIRKSELDFERNNWLLGEIVLNSYSNAQTPITDGNFQDAINTCLTTNPVDGMCNESEYGAMPDWDVSNVTDMSNAFEQKTDLNADISNWDVINVTNMSYMFSEASAFNGDISNWNVSNVTNMQGMFFTTSFNQDIGSWNVSNVTTMFGMFSYASAFNQDIGSWNVSNVTNMFAMFNEAESFNQDIGNWDVSNVTDTRYMFSFASAFNQDISGWCVSNIPETSEFSKDSPLTESNKPVWGTCPVLGIDDQYLTNISIYPNPTNDKLFIQGLSDATEVSIYNILGKEVISTKNTSNINVKALPKGVYIIRISNGVGQTNRRFIKN